MIKANDPRKLSYVRGTEDGVISEMFNRMGEAALFIDDLVRIRQSASGNFCVLCGKEYPYHDVECKAGKIIEKMNVLIW